MKYHSKKKKKAKVIYKPFSYITLEQALVLYDIDVLNKKAEDHMMMARQLRFLVDTIMKRLNKEEI